MNDTYTTESIAFAACVSYIFGTESLKKVETFPDSRITFTFEAPSSDCEIYFQEFERGEMQLTDAKALIENYAALTRRLSFMRKDASTVWTAPRTEAWWASARQSLAERQHQREQREGRSRR